MKVICCVIFLCLRLSAALPNVVILLADDLGVGDVGCFGNETIKTPNIDWIATQGVKLNHHLAAAAVCTPSRSALFTGRYPVRSGMESSGRNKVFFFVAASGGLPENETTIAKALKQKGYATALIGKWHLGNNGYVKGDLLHHPLQHGFDKFYGLPLSNVKDFGNDGQSVITSYSPHFYKYLITLAVCGLSVQYFLFSARVKLALCILVITVIVPGLLSTFLLNLKTINGVLMRNSEVIEQPLRLEGLTQRFVKEATSFIQEKAMNQTPFFLFLSFVHVHTALFTAPQFKGISKHGRYGDNIEELDWAVGEIFYKLSEFGITNNTFVYFSSDNGGHIEETGVDGQREGGHNGIFKGGKTMAGFEGGIRVPSIISWPHQIAAGLQISVPTSQMDIFPTILQITGIPLPSDRVIDGKSLLPLLKNQKVYTHQKVLFHYCGRSIHAATYVPESGSSVWKIHWTTPRFQPNSTRCEFVCHCYGQFVVNHSPPLLYDLSKDPSEEKPLDVKSELRYQNIINAVEKLRADHEASVDKVPDQFSFFNTIWKPWLQPCCNFPRCHCTELKYQNS